MAIRAFPTIFAFIKITTKSIYMKKNYILAAFVLASTLGFAQRAQVIAPQQQSNEPKFNYDPSTLKATQPVRTVESRWLNYGLQVDNLLYGNIADPNFLVIFPDTNIILGQYTDGTTARPQFMKAGTMIDPVNMIDPWLTSAHSYKLDSLAIAYAYTRTTASTVVDTLRIDIIKHSAALEYTLSGGETYQDIEYTASTGQVKANNILATYYYYLTENDSSDYVAEILMATPHNLASSARVGAVVTFKPGYSYTGSDSLHLKNAFYLFTYEEQGENTDPIYLGAPDMNVSYVL